MAAAGEEVAATLKIKLETEHYELLLRKEPLLFFYEGTSTCRCWCSTSLAAAGLAPSQHYIACRLLRFNSKRFSRKPLESLSKNVWIAFVERREKIFLKHELALTCSKSGTMCVSAKDDDAPSSPTFC